MTEMQGMAVSKPITAAVAPDKEGLDKEANMQNEELLIIEISTPISSASLPLKRP